MIDTYSYEDAEIPSGFSQTEYQRRYRQTEAGRRTRASARRQWKKTEGGKASRKRGRKARADREYLKRQFLAWDGEGCNVNDKHRYVLLANSVGDRIVRRLGLSTAECLDLLLRTKERYPDAIHIIYGGGYDFNFWLHSLSREDVEGIYRAGQEGYQVGKYRIWWRPHKFFRVREGNTTVTVYDVLSFFQRSFVKACDEYLGNDWEGRDLVIAEKARRGQFTVDELEDIGTYNDLELVNLVRLMIELRARLDRVGLRPGRWDGPGAVAAALLSEKEIRNAKTRPDATPEHAAYAIRCAYAGGRFEMLKYGSVRQPAYEYDVNSAYPHALRFVPCLAHGKWVRHDGDPGHREFAVYHVRYRGPQDDRPAPLYRRHAGGQITYPGRVYGWYWTPEVDALREYVERTGRGHYEITDAWEWVPAPDDCQAAGHSPHPFDWIPEYYAKRRELKAAGDGAHVGIKLALNSLYGKLAQQVGWRVDQDGQLRIPPYHELAWAGYVTAVCRGLVLRAALEDLDAVIAFETDALFTSRPLQLPLGTGLGEWEGTEFQTLAYCQSGTYFGTDGRGMDVVRTRGVDLGTVTLRHFEAGLRQARAADQIIEARLTRFMGAGISLAQDWADWCTWKTSPKHVTCGPSETSKRIHVGGCPACYTDREYRAGAEGIRLGVWHSTVCPDDGLYDGSYEYPIAWVHGKDYMPHLAELREQGYEEWDGQD